jgi:hypothetical protein
MKLGKPKAKLLGQDGNIFNLIGIAKRVLAKDGKKIEAEEMTQKVLASGSYDEALTIIASYVDIH